MSCQVGVGLGWGFGAAYGANYLRIAPSFAESRTAGARRSNPLQALQQQLRRLLGREPRGAGSTVAANSSAGSSKLAVRQK